MDYLAFDFGDGTTVAATYDGHILQTKEIQTGITEIWTCWAQLPNGSIRIGKSALKEGVRPGAKLATYWKERPSCRNRTKYTYEERKHFTVSFMQHVFRDFQDCNPTFQNSDTFKTIIGVPCQWNDEDIKIYKSWAEEAGLVNVEICKESQAAVLYARKFLSHNKLLRENALLDGILMIDLGSSTTDFTYLHGNDKPINAGLNLGAHKIEEILLDRANPNKQGYLPGDNRLVSLHLGICRECKEGAYSTFTDYPDTSDVFSGKIKTFIGGKKEEYVIGTYDEMGNEIIEKEWLETTLNDTKFTLEGGSDECNWHDHFKNALTEFVKGNNINKDKLSVIVTGGASRMYFVHDDILSVLGATVNIVSGNSKDSTEAVAKGLAWAGYANSVYRQEADPDKIEKKLREKCDFDTILDKELTKEVEKGVLACFSPVCDKLKQAIETEEINSYSSLVIKFNEYFEEFFNNNVSRIFAQSIIQLEKSKQIQSFWSDIREKFGVTNFGNNSDIAISPYSINFNFNITSVLKKEIRAVTVYVVCISIATAILGLVGVAIGSAIAAVILSTQDDKIPNSWKEPKDKAKLLEVYTSLKNRQDDLVKKLKEEISAKILSKEKPVVRNRILDCIKNNRIKELNALFAIFDEQI